MAERAISRCFQINLFGDAVLEATDTTKKLDKLAYQEAFPQLRTELRELQQRAREVGLPVIVVFEGFHMSGKGDAIKHLGEALDPRGFRVHSTDRPTDEERERHWLWRFWIRFAHHGAFSLFEKSWYSRVLDERVLGMVSTAEASHACTEINQTEEMLTRDGTLIVKFWLHITKRDQKQRLKAAEEDPTRRYAISTADWNEHDRYDAYLKAAEEMLERTSTHHAPWIIVEAGDHRYRRVRIFQALRETVSAAIVQAIARKAAAEAAPKPVFTVTEGIPRVLDKVDLKVSLPAEEYEKKKEQLQLTLRQLQYDAIERGLSQAVVMEGADAAGKGGAIRRVTANLDPRHFDVVPIAKPTPEEKENHYLWRFWRAIPKAGNLTIFDRSWYGRVLVERIEGFCTEDDWRRAYQEINEFEAMLHTGGTTVIKFWLHISQDEQLKRFEARQADPHKSWKLTAEDWRNRDKWQQYCDAVDEMVKRTSTAYAPWTIIEANCKRYARVRVMETVIAALRESIARYDAAGGKKTAGKAKKKLRTVIY